MLEDVVCFSHLRWAFVYQRPNHLMSRCARERRVFFVEEPIVGASAYGVALYEVAPNVTSVVVHMPTRVSARDSVRRQRDILRRVWSSFGVRAPVVWLYTPMALELAEGIDARCIVYDCMDELSAFDGAPPDFHLHERRLFARADVVFAGGHSLFEAKRPHHDRVFAFPSSVDASHFSSARIAGAPDPEDQRPLPRPRIGFFGVVDERMDRDLLARLADARPDWQIVILGPVVKIDPASLPRRSNLHYLGPKSYDVLPRYIAGWDVAIMPFADNRATRFISPTKTLEYLAAGKPVVSTPVRDVVHPYGQRGLVRVASGDAFIDAVGDALRERGTAEADERRAAADAWVASTSWDRTWDEMHALVREVVEQGRSVA
jgi:UDP-galactopyranose mutase